MLVLDGAGHAGHNVLVAGADAELDSGTAVAEGAVLQCIVEVGVVYLGCVKYAGVYGFFLHLIQVMAVYVCTV